MTPSTKDRILDAAEELFAEKSYDAASLRALTRAAGVNLAAVHYHFGSKKALYQAMFERRVGDINRRRLELLAAAEERAAGGPVPVEELLEALIGPALRRCADCDQGWGRFLQILGRANSACGEHVEAILDVFREVQERFLPAFRAALPDLPPTTLLWRLHFVMGAMCTHLASPDRIRLHTAGLCTAEDPEVAVAELVTFAAHGLRAPAPDPTPSPAAEETAP